MIVCHCNVIRGDEIHTAVRDLHERDGLAVITPGVVFRCCGARPQCGGCMPNFTQHIDEVLEILIGATNACPETGSRSKVTRGQSGGEANEGQQEGHRVPQSRTEERADRGQSVLAALPTS